MARFDGGLDLLFICDIEREGGAFPPAAVISATSSFSFS